MQWGFNANHARAPCATMFLPSGKPMKEDEKRRLSAVLHATEYLFLENMAPKLVLEHRVWPIGRSWLTIGYPTRKCWEACG